MRTFNLSCLALGALLSAVVPALAQAPTQAQQQAIRSNCVSDYRANCSGVPTGGMDALICLEKNVDRLSPACKSAVEAVEPASSSAPATASSSSSSATASSSAAETAASSDAASAQAESDAEPADTDDASTASASAAPSSGADEASTPAASAATSPAAAPKLSFRQELRVAGGSCAVDFRLLCPNLPVGHGNVLFCLQVHWQRLDTTCRDALTRLGVGS